MHCKSPCLHGDLVDERVEAVDEIVILVLHSDSGKLRLLPGLQRADDVFELALDAVPIESQELAEKMVLPGLYERPGKVRRWGRRDVRISARPEAGSGPGRDAKTFESGHGLPT